MGRKIVVILLFWNIYAQAQDSKFRKLEKLNQKDQFDKCITKSLSLKKKYPKFAEPDYYLAISYYKKYELEQKLFLLKKSIQYVEKGFNKNENLKAVFDEQLIGLHHAMLEFAEQEKNKRRKQKLADQLAFIFHDTISHYYLVHKIVNKPKTKVIDTFPPGEINREYMLAVAEDLIGVPYKYGGEDTNGFDCSGFVKYVYQKVGMKLPHNAHMISKLGEIIPREEARKGDVVLFGYQTGNSYRAYHAGIVYDEGDNFRVIHCVNGGVKVAINDWENHWNDRVLFVKRIINE